MLRSWAKKRVQKRIETHLLETIQIQRSTVTVDEYGSQTTTTETTQAKGYLTSSMNRSAADMLAAADQGRAFYMLHVAHDTDLRDGDVVLIDGETYRTEQVMRSQTADVMRQAVVVKAGS